jgi:hypothetical protein
MQKAPEELGISMLSKQQQKRKRTNKTLNKISCVPGGGGIPSLCLRFAPVRLEDLERAEQAGVDVHERASVVELAAVVWRGEDGNQLPVGEELVPVLHDLLQLQQSIGILDMKKKNPNSSACLPGVRGR